MTEHAGPSPGRPPSVASSDYFVDPAWGSEQERLHALEAWGDPHTIRHLEHLGVAPGWTCLEAGAGAGSIARWLAGRVAPSGRVVAADIDTRFLAGLEVPGLEIRTFDLRAEEFPPATFDLIHARLLLMHLPDRLSVMKRLAQWLRPGGWLLVEEADDYATQTTSRAALRRWWRAVAGLGAFDLRCGRALPGEVASLGLDDVDAAAAVMMVRGATPAARFVQYSMAMARDPIIAERGWSARQYDRLMADLDDPAFLEPGLATVSVWGRRPSGASS
ncbi:MAG: class I SAM-dependent methyltransferase [Acidimicrobiia bacterium]